MYHLGFFYNLPGTYNKSRVLILGYVNSCFKFIETEHNKIPLHYFYDTNNYHNLSYPVVFNLNCDCINEIVFLKDMEIVENPANELKMKASSEGFSILKMKNKDLFYLQYNGKLQLFDEGYSEQEHEFIHLLVNYTAAQKLIQKYSKSSTIISSSDEYNDYKWKKVISTYKEYIDSIDLSTLLSSLYVKVWDIHIPKIGGDDRYYVYRRASLQDGTKVHDPYLIDLIGIGEVCISRDSGYTSYFERPNIHFGEYQGEILEEEKKRIIANYSKEEHMGWLFYNQLFKQKNETEKLNKWQQEASKLYKDMKEKYCIEKMSNLDQRFFYDLTKDNIPILNKYVERINKKLPDYKIIFSGTVSKEESTHFLQKISKIIEDLSKNFNVIIVTGNSKGAEALALNYAKQHFVEFINNYSMWTMLGKDRGIQRARKMTEMSNVIYLTGNKDYFLNKNFISASDEYGKEVRFIF